MLKLAPLAMTSHASATGWRVTAGQTKAGLSQLAEAPGVLATTQESCPEAEIHWQRHASRG
jgi:hypothetical protein